MSQFVDRWNYAVGKIDEHAKAVEEGLRQAEETYTAADETALDLDLRAQRRWLEAFLELRLGGVFMQSESGHPRVGLSVSATLAWHRPEPTGGAPCLDALYEVYAPQSSW
jgi:hypothetical protein